MLLTELPEEIVNQIKQRRYDSIVEKHEGPFSWDSVFKYDDVEFMNVEGYNVLLPVDKERHGNITILRTVVDKDEAVLTLFLKDTSFVDDPQEEWFMAGYLAICERIGDENIYIATVYHEWFII